MPYTAIIICAAMFSFLFQTFGSSSDWIPDLDRKLVVYVGWPLKSPTEWRKAKHYGPTSLELADGTTVQPNDVRSHLLVYPNNEVVGGTNLFHPLPAGVKFLEPSAGPERPLSLDSAQLEYGKALCRVKHHRFRKDADGNRVYATTLHNISNKRLRIQKFAGFRHVGKDYVLHTVTGKYYTDEQFRAWYAVPEDGWINPDGQVTDENNYGGGDGIWAYFGLTEDGNHFIVTDKLPR